MQTSVPNTYSSSSAYWPGLSIARLIIMLAVAFGYISTMPIGPEAPEWGRMFGYDPSWIGMNVLFLISGYLAMRSLNQHGSPVKMWASRAQRNLPGLILFAILVVVLIFPIFGVPADKPHETLHRLADYFFGVVTCTDPGAVLPGLLDDAKYMCLIQGAIWTLRWGAIAYLALGLGWMIGLFQNRLVVGLIGIAACIAYIALVMLSIQGIYTVPEALQPAFRLSVPFLIGAAAFGYRDTFKRRRAYLYIMLAICCIVWLTVQWYALTWTPLIELTLTAIWTFAFIALIKFLNKITPRDMRVPELALGVFLFHWPIAQLLLLNFPELTSGPLIALTLPITLLAAWALDRFNLRIAPWIGRRIFRRPKQRHV